MKRHGVLRAFWLLLGLTLGACQQNGGTQASDGDSELAEQESIAESEPEAEAEIEADRSDPDDPRPIGSSCLSDAACQSGYCLNDERLQEILPSGVFVSLPHGLCTLLDCNIEQPDPRCPNNERQHCVSNYALSKNGPGLASGMCLQTCRTTSDCLLVDAPYCLDPTIWVKAGLLSEGDRLRYFADRWVCLPQSFKDFLETLLKENAGGN